MENQYLIALMVFFIAYTVFEVPSNYLLKKYKPSRWFSFLMLVWGAMTMLIAATRNYGGLIVTRFLLGAFEAGIFPGLVYCLTFWYKPNERAIRVGIILAGATLGGAFGSAMAFGIGTIDGAGGLEGWRWLFLIEGAASCLFVPVIFLFYPDYPETVCWLLPEERKLAIERIKGVASLGHEKTTWKDARDTLLDWRLYLHHLIWIAYSVGFSSISLFAPTIVQGLGFEGLRAQLFTVPPYAIAFCVVTTVAWVADRYEMRSWCMAGSFAICGVAFVVEGPRSAFHLCGAVLRADFDCVCACTGSLPSTAFTARYAVLCVAVPFAFSISGPTLSWLTANLRGTGASTLAVPLNGSVATFGQIIGTPAHMPFMTPLRPLPDVHSRDYSVPYPWAVIPVLFLVLFLPTKSSRMGVHRIITDDAALRRDIHLQVIGVAGLSHRSLYKRRLYVLRGPPRAGVTARLHATQSQAGAGRADMEAIDWGWRTKWRREEMRVSTGSSCISNAVDLIAKEIHRGMLIYTR